MQTVSTNLLLSIFLIALIAVGCGNDVENQANRIMPGGTAPEKLYVFEISKDIDWHQRSMLACYQGLVNRIDTRIYFVETKQDQFWLDYYKETFGIRNEHISSIKNLLLLFADEINGYILYKPEEPHSINIATTMGSLKNLLPVPPDLEPLMVEIGIKKLDEVQGYTDDRIEVYSKAMDELLPQCNQNLLAALCVHHPHWPTTTVKNKDYIMAHNIFSFDLSSSERDKSDYNLIKEIYGNMKEGAVVMGWHCVRDKEHEAIGLASEFGHFGMCSLHTPNLTVHSSIPLPPEKKFSQRILNKDKIKVENKVYIALMATDGDATWFMNDHAVNDWADSARGKLKYNWGFLPLAYDLMPGTVKYYLENSLATDYFVAGPAGATYTYPYLHPDPTRFLNMSDDYMERCGLTTVHMTNWNDRDWWQEVNLPGFHDQLQTDMPKAIGFVRGMGESAFEESIVGGGKPYIFCGEGIHKGDDVYLTLKKFIDACPNRPLFIYSLVNHSIPMGEIKKAMDKFSANDIESVHLDELLKLADKAFEEGKISTDLYPDKTKIKQILVEEAKNAWPGFMDDLRNLEDECSGNEAKYRKNISMKPIGVEPIEPGDHLAFTAIWHSMTMVKLALESKGIYVNHKPMATSQFLTEYQHIKDAKVVGELQELWDNWHQKNPDFDSARDLTTRLLLVAKEIDKTINKY